MAGNVTSSGVITLPFKDNILLINKEIYKIPDTNLLEIICFPLNLIKLTPGEYLNLKSLVIKLLKRLEIDQFALDEGELEQGIINNLETEEFSLSAGQNQKLAIIQGVILNKFWPKNVIFLDEPWSNLDKRSEKLCKQLIVEEFKDKIVIVVDHAESKRENLSGIYKSEIHIENEAISQAYNPAFLELSGVSENLYQSEDLL